ncbi:MAG: glycosyltransferase family 39 protein, partial [Deltaproteobacteria bacterium]|nr:glycosyltransferase family 39 protein [Deltaproteobacteria bacterium]
KHCRSNILGPITLILILGFVVRLFACQNTHVINSDGVLYINQARAIYYGQWDRLLHILRYVSSYPVFIAGSYPIFHNWVVAAKSVSLFFGSLTLIPVYLILKQHLNREITALCLLVFALTPLFVSLSGDALRGPVSWFFLAFGIYFFSRQTGKKKRPYLAWSCIFFLMGTSARIEVALFIIISAFYILVVTREEKLAKLIYFLVPLLFLVPFFFLGREILGISLNNVYRLEEIPVEIAGIIPSHVELRAGLEVLIDQLQKSTLGRFLEHVYHLTWIIPLGVLLRATIEDAFFYPFFVLFVIGVLDVRTRIKNDRRILYLVFLSFGAVMLVYFHTFRNWILSSRFLHLFVISSFVFVGFGLEKTEAFLRSRFNLRAQNALAILCFLILALGLPKNLRPERQDKQIYKQIGLFISQIEGEAKQIPVVATSHQTRFSFYANLNFRGVPDQPPLVMRAKSYAKLVRELKKGNIMYFLWEEQEWPTDGFPFIKEVKDEDLVQIKSWTDADRGRLILFKVVA